MGHIKFQTNLMRAVFWVFTLCGFDTSEESMPFISSVTESVHADLRKVMNTK